MAAKVLRSPVNRVKGVRATVRKFKQTEELMTGVRVIFFNGGIFFFIHLCMIPYSMHYFFTS